MAGGKLVALEGGASGARNAPKAEPLAENIDRHPIWVHVPDKGKLTGIFRALARELDSQGLKCDRDLQTEPHAGLDIVDFFEVFLCKENKRQPEIVGMVTLYTDGEGKAVMKISPQSSALAQMFRSALARSIEREIGAMAESGSMDLEVVIRQQADYRPAVPGGDEGPISA